MLMDLNTVRLHAWSKVGTRHTHPSDVSWHCVKVGARCAYDSYFATKLVLDFSSLDRTRRVFLYELEKVLNTHFGCRLR